MKLNESSLDRLIYILVGITLTAIGFSGGGAGAWLYITYIFGAVLALAGFTGFRPFDRLFKFSTINNQ
jgi:hypothetical protein